MVVHALPDGEPMSRGLASLRGYQEEPPQQRGGRGIIDLEEYRQRKQKKLAASQLPPGKSAMDDYVLRKLVEDGVISAEDAYPPPNLRLVDDDYLKRKAARAREKEEQIAWTEMWDELYDEHMTELSPEDHLEIELWEAESGQDYYSSWAPSDHAWDEAEYRMEAKKTKPGRVGAKLRNWFSRVNPNLLRTGLITGAGKALSPFADALLDASLTAEEANPQRGSQPRHTYMSQQEMDREDLDLQPYVDIYGSDPSYLQDPQGGAGLDPVLRELRSGTPLERPMSRRDWERRRTSEAFNRQFSGG